MILLGVDAAGRRLKITKAFNTYGCNNSLRLATVREHKIRFSYFDVTKDSLSPLDSRDRLDTVPKHAYD